MIQVSEIVFGSARPVDGYGPGFFRIGGEVLHGPVLVTAEAARSWGGPEDIAPLLALAGRIDVLLLGTGAQMMRAPAALAAALDAVGTDQALARFLST